MNKIPSHYSDELLDILSSPPHFLIRFGLTIIGLIFGLLLLGTWFIRYPETIEAPITLTTAQMPKPVIARTSGKLGVLKVSDTGSVQQGDYLGFIESTGNIEDILSLEQDLLTIKSKMEEGRLNAFSHIFVKEGYNVGPVHQSYSVLYYNWADLVLFLQDSLYYHRLDNIKHQIENQTDILQSLKHKQELSRSSLDLAKTRYENQEELYKKNLISWEQWSIARSNLYGSQSENENIEMAVLQNLSDKLSLENELLQQQQDIEDRVQRFRNQVDIVIEDINRWKMAYGLIAPTAGKIALTSLVTEGQYVQENQVVMHVVPGNKDYVGEVYVNQFNSGKIREGQKVLVKLLSYPSPEYGALAGTVKSISFVPAEAHYLVKVSLPVNLITTYNKQLYFRERMIGTAEIITQDLRVIQRIVYKFRTIVSR